VKGWAAFAGERIGGGEGRTELTGGEGVEGTEARGKFGGGQAAFAVERAEKILGGAFPFLRVALKTAGDEVAVRIAPQLHAGHDVVEAVNAGGEPAETVKAVATLACMDGLAQRLRFQEVRLLEIDGARDASRMASSANLVGQPNFDHVTGLAALDQAQSTVGNEAAEGFARGGIREARSSGEPGNGKAQPAAAFEATVPKKVGINGAVYDGQTQTRHQKVFQVFPDLFGVGLFDFHVQIQERKLTIESRKFRSEEKKQRLNTEDTEAGARRSKEKTPARCRRYKGGGSGCCRNLQYRALQKKKPRLKPGRGTLRE
jgi:hypothetical protein